MNEINPNYSAPVPEESKSTGQLNSVDSRVAGLSKKIPDDLDLSIEKVGSSKFSKEDSISLASVLFNHVVAKKSPEKSLALFEKACLIGRFDLAQKLFEKGLVDRKVKNADGDGILHIACRYGDEALVTKILSQTIFQKIKDWITGENPLKEVNRQGLSPLDVACQAGHMDKFLLDRNYKDKNGDSMLMLACKAKEVDRVRWCLEHGVDLNVRNDKGQGPIFAALYGGNQEILDLILEAGCDPNEKSGGGGSIIATAVQYGDDKFVLKLLEKGAKTSSYNRSPGAYESLLLKLNNSYQLSSETKKRLKEADNGFTEEMLRVKYLGHAFSLDGTSPLAEGLLPLEGNVNANTFNSYSEAIGIHYDKLREGEADFQKVWDRLSDETKEALNVPEALEVKLARVPLIFKEAFVSKRYAAFQELGTDLPILFLGGWKGHAVGAVLYKNYLSRVNRGEGTGDHPGVVTQKISDRSLVEPMLDQFNEVNPSFFNQEIESSLDKDSVTYLEQKEQKVGNCTLASLRAAEFAVIYHLFNEQYGPEVAKDIARAVKRVRTFQSRQAAVDDYLDHHKSAESESFPPDPALLKRLLIKKKHEPNDVYKVRVTAIQDWAKRRNISL